MSIVTMNSVLASAVKDAGLDTLEGALAYQGGEDLDKPGLKDRRRTRVQALDAKGRSQTLYLKRYGPTGLWEVFRGWLRTRCWSSTAGREAHNVRRCRAANVRTMEVLAWDQKSAAGESYIVVSAVEGDAIERCGRQFLSQRPSLIPEMTDRLADQVRRLHAAGLYHRDLYASHVFLSEAEEGVDVYLIDLARVTRPWLRSQRWRVKDLAQLKYSMPEGWVGQYWPRFLAGYCGAEGGAAVINAKVDRKLKRMVKRIRRKEAKDPEAPA
jgi:tRNA A-37 threonylcarbamoyl transferase component Bud32